MLSMLAMYLLVKCTAIQNFFNAVCAIAFLIFGSSLGIKWLRLCDGVNDSQEKKINNQHNRFIWPFFTAGIIFLLCYMAMPDTKEMAIIYVTPKVVNSVMANEELKKLPNNLVSLANSWIEEFKPDTTKKSNVQEVKEKRVEKIKESKSIPDSTKQKIIDKVIDKAIEKATK